MRQKKNNQPASKEGRQYLSQALESTDGNTYAKTLLLVGFIVVFFFGAIVGYALGIKVKTSDLPQETAPANQRQQDSEKSKIVIEGSLYRILPSGEKKLLIAKPETGGITYFSESISPDNTKSFFMVEGGISHYLLYYLPPKSELAAERIDFAQEAVWSNNSRYIAYAKRPADAGALVSIFVYDTLTQKVDEISKGHEIENTNYDYLGFSDLEWLDNDSGIKAHYDAYTERLPGGEKVSEGETILRF